MPAEKTTTSASIGLRVLAGPGPVARLVAEDPLGGGAGVQGEAELLDVPGQGRAAGVVDLHRHQPGRHLDDVGVEAELVQRVGGLEAEQAATDHGTGRRRVAASRIASRSSMVR